MPTFQQPFWGYEIDIPEDWVHQTMLETEGFARNLEALGPQYEGPDLGHLLIRGEWNPTRQDIQPLWSQHITRLATMLAAKKLGSAPWDLAGGQGYEAEILLPKTTGMRLWVGLLSHDQSLLHFLVTHRIEERDAIEPVFTQIISSIRFIDQASGISHNQEGVPLPPGYASADPASILADLQDVTQWQAYQGQVTLDALQAFYWRELPNRGFMLSEYLPYSPMSDLGFARFNFSGGDRSFTLGILPSPQEPTVGTIVIQSNPQS